MTVSSQSYGVLCGLWSKYAECREKVPQPHRKLSQALDVWVGYVGMRSEWEGMDTLCWGTVTVSIFGVGGYPQPIFGRVGTLIR